MSMRLTLTAASVLLLASMSQPPRADAVSDGVAMIPGAVEDVRIVGTWDDNGRSGVFRVIVARSGGDAVTARLFVQWVAYQSDGGATVDASIEIAELGELGVDIDDVTAESDVAGLTMFIRTIDPNGNGDLTYELFVFSPTDYRFGPASN
jgi:hypothetical protein